MGLKLGEAFKDRCFLTVLATGAPATLLADVTCTIIDESGNRAGGVVTEESDGWYTCPFTPDAAGTWATEWSKTANPEDYVFHYPYKEFHAGAGQEATLQADVTAIITDTNELQTDWHDGGRLDVLLDGVKAKTDNLPADPADESNIIAEIDANEAKIDAANAALVVIDEFHDVPAQNAVVNAQMNEVIGNKTDDPSWFTDDVSSLMKFAKAAAASGGGLTYSGKCDTGMGASTTTIVCDDLKGFGDDYFNTDWVMTVTLNDDAHGTSPEGNAPRDVTDYESATGTFTVAAFADNVEEEDKIIVQRRNLHVIDKCTLAAIPTVDSFAYKICQFLADGDGDFAAGTPLPSNKSLYDILNAKLITRSFFSPSQKSVTVPAGAADLALPSVTLPNISGTVVHVYAGFKFRMIENTNAGANKLSGAQEIQLNKAGGAWADCIHFVDDQFGVAASTREGGDCIVGYTDVAGTVDVFNVVVNFQWDEAVADLASLVLNDVQTFLIVSYY